MIKQIVKYTPNPRNENASRLIVAEAQEMLGKIPNTTLTIGVAIDSDRVVSTSNRNIIKITSWSNKFYMQEYFKHPNLITWCKFVLKGWMIKDSQSEDPEEEFIQHILFGNQKLPWARNPQVSEDEVVWENEEIIIFAENDVPVVLPYGKDIIASLSLLGSGTNANWESIFCKTIAEQATNVISNSTFSMLLSRAVRKYLEGAPPDLRQTVRLKIPKIVELFVDEINDQKAVCIQMLRMVPQHFCF